MSDEAQEEEEQGEYPELLVTVTMITVPETALLAILRQVAAGADPDLIYMEYFAAGIIEGYECECEEDCAGDHCGCAWCELPDCDCDECLALRDEDEEDDE